MTARVHADAWVAAQDLIERLPDVVATTFTSVGPSGEPAEIQVFTQPDTDGERIRDLVERLVSEVAGSEKELRIITLALAERLDPQPQPSPDMGEARWDVAEEPEVRTRPARRPRVLAATLQTEAGRLRGLVRLEVGGVETTGRAEGQESSRGLLVIAEATVDAVARAFVQPIFRVQGAALVEMFRSEAVCVWVTRDDDPTRRLLGAAFVRDVPIEEATARATLDAINRQL